MTPLSVYQMQDGYFKKTFGNFVSKIYNNDKSAAVTCRDNHEVSAIDDLLWTYSQLSFLPHYTAKDSVEANIIKAVYIGTQPVVKFESNIFMSPDLVTNVGRKVYVVDKENHKSDDLINLFSDFSLKIFSQSKAGIWEKKF